MNTNETVKKKGFSKAIIMIVVLVVIILGVGFAYARYITKLNGQVEAQVANWTFKVNGSTNDTFEIDLASTRAGIPQEANVEEGYIAPGTAGSFTITIDASNSDASLTYDLIINSTNIPKNLVFYSDSNMENVMFYADSKIEFGDYINYNDNNKTRSKTFYWNWPYESGILQEEIAENDEDDSQWMGDEISLSVSVVGKQIDKEPDYLVKIAEPGDYVNYVDGNGDTVLCRVLYNDGTNGLQIVTDDVVKENNIDRLIALGTNDSCTRVKGDMGSIERAQNSYNRAIQTLNEYAMEYLNSDLAYSARCIGTKPTNKNSESMLYKRNDDWFSRYNDKYKDSDTNSNSDYKQLVSILSINIGKNYWLGSRHLGVSSNGNGFYIKPINSDGTGTVTNRWLWFIYSRGATYISTREYGLRPVFSINSNIKITEGDGSENSPFELGY